MATYDIPLEQWSWEMIIDSAQRRVAQDVLDTLTQSGDTTSDLYRRASARLEQPRVPATARGQADVDSHCTMSYQGLLAVNVIVGDLIDPEQSLPTDPLPVPLANAIKRLFTGNTALVQ